MPLYQSENRDREFTPLVPLRLRWLGGHVSAADLLMRLALISALEWAAVLDGETVIRG